MHPVDWNPLVVAVAGLIVALTPIAAAIVTLRLRGMEARLQAGQRHLADRIQEVPQRVIAVTADTPPSAQGAPVDAVSRRGGVS